MYNNLIENLLINFSFQILTKIYENIGRPDFHFKIYLEYIFNSSTSQKVQKM